MYATNETGLWIWSTIDNNASTGAYSSLAIDSNDKIHVSYYGQPDLWYATNRDGGWKKYKIDHSPGAIVGGYTSLAIDSRERLHISYYDF
ncbi:MAG: carboxypeptidase regulatory-like domain-containing protein, partial [Thermoplasmata archaeon]